MVAKHFAAQIEVILLEAVSGLLTPGVVAEAMDFGLTVVNSSKYSHIAHQGAICALCDQNYPVRYSAAHPALSKVNEGNEVAVLTHSRFTTLFTPITPSISRRSVSVRGR